ncbi:MAG: hypothetical protein J5640_07365 [Bacteroidales bacterium]|nr:hypothetical protein [Bacteroidales bacterium]
MKKYFAFAAIAFAALVSCQKETAPADEMPVAPVRDGYVEITLSAQCDAQTKAILDGNTVVWAVGDEVAVYAGDATTPEKFTVSAVDFDAVKLTGSVPAGASTFIAVYPFSQAGSREGNVVDVTIPDWQVIPAGGNVCPEALSSVAYFADAAAKPQFKNTFSLVGICVNKEEVVDAGVWSAEQSGYQTGQMKVTVSTTGEAPEIVNCSGGFYIMAAPDGGLTPGKTYYIVVPPTPEVKRFEVFADTECKWARREKTESFALPRNKGIDLGDALKDCPWCYSIIMNADQLIDFLSEASTYPGSLGVNLMADIDLEGKTVVPAESWAAHFDGHGHTIKNWAASNALFATNSGYIWDLKIDSSCSINWTDAIEDMTGIAFIVSKGNTGVIRNCEVAGNITIKSDQAGRVYCGGVVGESTTGLVDGCKFTGKIDVELTTTSQSVSSIGGVAARVGHVDKAGEVIVKDCVNEGSIKFVFSGETEQMKKFGIGGVVGLTPTVANAPSEHGIIEGCVNKGTVEWSYPAGGKGSYPAMGGVIGACEGQIRGCSNYGSIKYTGGKSIAATDASFGGVAGYVTGNASDCHNYGQMIIDAGIAGGTAMAQGGGNTQYSSFGGVFGGAGPFMSGKYSDMANNSSTEVTVENCTNEVAIQITPSMISTGGPVFCCGGVVGAATAHLVNCHNKADILIKSNTKFILGGALAGFIDANVTNCTNTGNLVVDGDKDNNPINAQQHYVGGLIGVAAKQTVIKDCQNSGNTTLQNVVTYATAYNYLGGINGGYSGSQLTMQSCTNSGTVTANFDGPLCFGGLSGGFNGLMKECQNSGDVINTSSYTSAGKEAEVGGLIGYANADIDSCINTGSVSSACSNGAVGGFVGGFGEAEKTFTGVVDAPVSGAFAGSIFGWFRKDTEHTITLGTSSSALEVTANTTVNGAVPAIDNIVGNIKGGKTENVNLIIAGNPISSASFTEDLANLNFRYAGREYPIVQLADGRWWMASNLAYLPAGMTPSTDVNAVTAGVFAPIKINAGQTALEFTTDEADIAAKGYLYQAEVALGLSVGAITSAAQAQALEKAQGICPPGWHVPSVEEIVNLVGKCVGMTTKTDAPYYNGTEGSMALLNAAGFGMDAYGMISIQDVTKTNGSLMGFMTAYKDRISSGMFCGSSFAGVTYNTTDDASSGIKNMQFYGFMPMTNKADASQYTCNGTKVSYRIAAPLRCIRNVD